MSSNLRPVLPDANEAAFIATIRGVIRYQRRAHAKGEKTPIRAQMTAERRRRALARFGLEIEDWLEYRRLQISHGLKPSEAAGVILNDRGRARS